MKRQSPGNDRAVSDLFLLCALLTAMDANHVEWNRQIAKNRLYKITRRKHYGSNEIENFRHLTQYGRFHT